jgi:delta14-sterol reductase
MIAGFFAPWLVYAAVLLLHLGIPARRVQGYVLDDTGTRKLHYRLNGLRVMAVSVALWAAACQWAGLPWDYLWTHRWEGLAGACALGLLFTAAVVVGARPVRGLLGDVFWGRRANPQWGDGRVDAKMYLYLIGAVMLELNILSMTAHHLLRHPADPSPGVLLYAAMFTFFLSEYLFFERVHLYTYDFVAERVGFKLGWGCMVFYPYFYCIGLWSEAPLPNPGTHPLWLAASALCFAAGWVFARGANMQKYAFKTRPQDRFLGRLAPETQTDGTRGTSTTSARS